MSPVQASFAVSGVSLTITLIYQLLYCLPHWQQLVAQPFAASGLSLRTVLLTHAVYGAITAVHQYVQLRVLGSHGAMSVGLVNAVRASVVSVVSSLLFCNVKPQLCLTSWRAISALVVTVGAVQWVVAGERRCRAGSRSSRCGGVCGAVIKQDATAGCACASIVAPLMLMSVLYAAVPPSAGKPLTRQQLAKKQE